MKQVFAVTVIGKDRPGIIAALTEAIFKSGGNLEDISMTVLEGEFAMIVLVCLEQRTAYPSLLRRLNRLEQARHLMIQIKAIRHALIPGERHPPKTDSYVVSVFGKDRAGIVWKVSRLLAGAGGNITDLNSRMIGEREKTAYVLILEVDLPQRPTQLNRLKKKFLHLERSLGVSITFKPLESVRF